MSKPDNSLILYLALVFTIGLSVGGLLSIGVFWLLNRVAPASISNKQYPPTTKLLTGQLTLLGDTFSGYSTFRNPAFGRELKESGVSLRYADEFNQAKRAEMLRQGQADFLVTTLDQFLKQKPPGKIVGLIDRTVGADAVVLNTKKYPNLKSLLDLNLLVQRARSQGQQLSIVFASDTPSEYLALVLSTKFESFKLSDFQIKRVADASQAWDMLQDPKENVAVAIVWEPYVTRARKQGYTVVLSSRDTPGVIVDAIVASNRLLQSQPDKVADLLSVYYRRIDANIRDASGLQNQIAEDGGLSPSDAATVLQGIEFFTAVESKAWLTNGTLEKRLTSTAAVLTLAGRMDRVPQSPKELFSAQPINKAASNTQTLISLVRADNPELADRLAGQKPAATRRISNPSQVTAAPNIGNLRSPGEVKFTRDSAELTATGQQTLDRLVKEVAEFNPQTVAVRVIGHTSAGGVAEFNQILSQRRAQVVADYMRSRGLRHNVVAEGKGSSQPLTNISPYDSRNQRTEIRLVRVN
ncbi:phosphate ABC transporter substrate-binding/OmpA family protein [Aliterella atlantica]|uniref:Membrane protein n=1 Tax=Aliterella atlantica CENA595 TaxID=1618023 RepID=A0A0D8ZRF1_9CYAN|nr:phosphate ABC transporter substrate-binding/OmpA family protein [Aliterella atlantica]KJH71295.1 membrane protein [Aliterella atlantica CENA595]